MHDICHKEVRPVVSTTVIAPFTLMISRSPTVTSSEVELAFIPFYSFLATLDVDCVPGSTW